MADQRLTMPAVITDPTTPTRQAAVDASGNLKVISAANDGVDIGSVDILSVVPGVDATNLGKAEDAAHSSGDVGVMILAKRTDTTPGATSGTDGDYEPLQVFGGRLWVTALLDTALPAGTNAIGKLAANSGVDIGDVDVISVIPGVGATNLGKAEDAAHSSGDTGVMSLGVRKDTATALAGSDGDYQPFIFDANGRLHVTDPNAAGATPSGAMVDQDSGADIAAGSSDTLRHTDIGGTTKRLAGITVASSVPFKAVISAVEDGAIVKTYDTIFSQVGGGTYQWAPPHKDYTENAFGANAGYDGYEAVVTNLDPADAASIYCTFYYES